MCTCAIKYMVKKVKYNLFLSLICCIFMVPECLWHRNIF